jgi:hypothetical protein
MAVRTVHNVSTVGLFQTQYAFGYVINPTYEQKPNDCVVETCQYVKKSKCS